MSAQSSLSKKSNSLLANLKSSYSSGNAFGFGQTTPAPVSTAPQPPISVTPVSIAPQPPISVTPTNEQVENQQVDKVQAQNTDLKVNTDLSLDTADASIQNILARRLENTTPQTPTVQSTLQPATDVSLAVDQPYAQVTTPQAFPLAVDQLYQEQQAQVAAQQQVYAQSGSASKKESTASSTPDMAIVDAGSGVQYVELEKNPELPVEVEGFLQHVDDNATQAPQEIIMAQLAEPVALPTVIPKQAVVVLPITPDLEQTAKRKNVKHSVKWLVEWSHKMMKLFEGKVVYRPLEDDKK